MNSVTNMQYLLNDWNFFKFSSWGADQTEAFWTAVGGVITALALVYALWKDRINSKRINDLANITDRLTDLNDSSLQQINLMKLELKRTGRPFIEAEFADNPKIEDISLTVKLINTAAIATIDQIVPASPNISIEGITFPKIIEENGTAAFRVRSTTNARLHNNAFSFEIYYTDGYGNTYKKNYRTHNFNIRSSVATDI